MTDELKSVINILNEYFGEEHVSLQDDYVFVHFPHLTVTNEYEKSIDIDSLYVRIPVNPGGRMMGIFSMLRSEYTVTQLLTGYVHSHVPRLDLSRVSGFLTPCLGTGPIRHTIGSLSADYDGNLWRLFCLELDRYVRTESIEGKPHIRLENVSVNHDLEPDSYYNSIRLSPCSTGVIDRSFFEYLTAQRPFRFNYINGSWGLACSVHEFRIILSNIFIRWCNENSIPLSKVLNINAGNERSILNECVVKDGHIYIYKKGRKSVQGLIDTYEGKELFIFKGEAVRLHIKNDSGNDDTNTCLIINRDLSMTILKAILVILNYNYGRRNNSCRTGYIF